MKYLPKCQCIMSEWCNKFNYRTQRGYLLAILLLVCARSHKSWHLPIIGRLNQLVVFQSRPAAAAYPASLPDCLLPIQPSIQLEGSGRWTNMIWLRFCWVIFQKCCSLVPTNFYGPLVTHASSSFSLRFSFWRQLYTRILWPPRLLLAEAAAWVSSPAETCIGCV